MRTVRQVATQLITACNNKVSYQKLVHVIVIRELHDHYLSISSLASASSWICLDS